MEPNAQMMVLVRAALRVHWARQGHLLQRAKKLVLLQRGQQWSLASLASLAPLASFNILSLFPLLPLLSLLHLLIASFPLFATLFLFCLFSLFAPLALLGARLLYSVFIEMHYCYC